MPHIAAMRLRASFSAAASQQPASCGRHASIAAISDEPLKAINYCNINTDYAILALIDISPLHYAGAIIILLAAITLMQIEVISYQTA